MSSQGRLLLRHLQRVSAVQGSINIIKGHQFPSETSSLPHLFTHILPPIPSVKTTRRLNEDVEMVTSRSEKQRLRYLRRISSGPIILQDLRNGDISDTSTSDLESLEKEMECLRLQAPVTPEAVATAMARRRFVIFQFIKVVTNVRLACCYHIVCASTRCIIRI